MSDKEYKFNPGSFGKKLHALFEGVYKEEEWKDEDETEVEDDKEETLPAPTTDEPPKDAPAVEPKKDGEVEEKEHKSVDALADAATKVQDAVSVIKASEELEHDGTITKDEHEKIEAKAVEKLDAAKEELTKAGEDFKAAEKEEGNPGIPTGNTPPAVPEENKVEKPEEIEEKKAPKSFKQYMS